MSPDKLRALADRIDHEELWRRPAMEHRDWSQDKIDRMNAAVELRRWANAKKPGRWLVIPPTGPVQFSADTLQKAAEMAKKHVDRAERRSSEVGHD
jgi:hypothetical protein